MFEGKPPAAAKTAENATATEAEGDLHPLSWHDLVARLSAARELQAALVHVSDATPGSFDVHSARQLATMYPEEGRGHPEKSRRPNGKQGVNLQNSADRKEAGRKSWNAERQQRPIPRGNP